MVLPLRLFFPPHFFKTMATSEVQTTTIQKEGESLEYVKAATALCPLDELADVQSIGLRYVPEEEDQMRWAHAEVLTLYQLQNRVCVHAG